MGGLATMMAAARRGAAGWIGLAPSPPACERDGADQTVPHAAYADLPLPAERLLVEGASHWGLVLNRRMLATLVPAVLQWISRVAPGPAGSPSRPGL
jgi:hypothetical protein